MDKTFYLKFGVWGGPYQTVKADAVRETESPRSPYVTGYGKAIPTPYMVKYERQWRRVYVTQYSNAGTAWVWVSGERVVVTEG